MTDSPQERIERLEERFAFLERDVEVLSDVLRTLGDRSDAIVRELSRLRSEVERPHASASVAGAADGAGTPGPEGAIPGERGAGSPVARTPDDRDVELPPHWGRRPGGH